MSNEGSIKDREVLACAGRVISVGKWGANLNRNASCKREEGK